MVRLLNRFHVEPLVQLFAFNVRMSERSTRKHPSECWEDLAKEPAATCLTLEELRGKFFRVAAAAMQQDYRMRMGSAWFDVVDVPRHGRDVAVVIK